VVKRFDPERGFGFVTLESSGGDGFLHISTLQRAGIDAVRPGMRLRVRLGQGERGPQVIEVLEVAGGDEVPQAPPGDSGQSSRAGPLVGEGEEVRGVVKWYNAEKGFGFVARDGGGKDVFVHATALERSGVRSLTEGQAVTLRVVQGKKGPEAASVTGA
jgi:CspA family cold shock protein